MDSLAPALFAPASLPWLRILSTGALAVAGLLALGFLVLGLRALGRRAAARARDREAVLLEDGLESLGHGFALFDDRGRLVRCNPCYCMAYPAIADLLVPGARLADILAAAALRGDRLAPGESLGDWVRARVDRQLADSEAEWHRLGDGRWYRISEFATGRGGVVKLLTDVTEERQREAALSHARRMEAVGRLAAGLAHEFNNILTAVGGFAELAHRASPPGAVRDHLTSVLDGTGRAGDLTRQLLDLSRSAEPRPEALPIGVAIARVEAMLRFLAGPRVRLSVELEDPGLAVMADAVALGHALINLTVNARDAMPEGGRLTVTARRGPAPADGERPMLALAVADTGTGIPPELRARVFEPFFTTKPAGVGTGLGLALVEATVRQSGGRMTVESAPGEGTTFTLLLPLAEADGNGAAEPEVGAGAETEAGAGAETEAGAEAYAVPPAAARPARPAAMAASAAGPGDQPVGDEPVGDVPAHGVTPDGAAPSDVIGGVKVPGDASRCAASAPEDPPARARARRRTVLPRTVLVVDDEGPIRDLVALALEPKGYRVLRAGDAAAALAAVERRPVGLVLADVMLPDATGPELAARLAEVRPELPVVFMSGIEPRRPADRRLVARGAPLIPKPFDEATLTCTVAGVLGAPAEDPAALPLAVEAPA